MKKTHSEKALDPLIPQTEGKYITKIEYISIALMRIGCMFSTTLTGTLAAAFLHELYFGPVGVGSEEIAKISAGQTTLSYIVNLTMPIIAGLVVQKWKSRWGRYRQWFIISSIPIFLLAVTFFYVPKGWSLRDMIMLRYFITAMQTALNAVNTVNQNITQVISPNHKEKKTVASVYQFSYYIGYGGAYLATFIYGLFSDDLNSMYLRLAFVAAFLTLIGNVMCGIFCKERIEIPKKEKNSSIKVLFSLFKYKNYRAYQYIQWASCLAALGKWSSYLVAITVGSSKNLLLTLPTAVGTVVGNVICTAMSKKHEPAKLLKNCGAYSMIAATFVFLSCFIQTKLDIYFLGGWNSIFFYVFYFIFGITIGIQELSTSHLAVEFFDYLEWQTGERIEAIQGIVPDLIKSGIGYVKDLLIPFILLWIGYKSSDSGNLAETMKAEPGYYTTCLWLVALLVFTYAIGNVIKALVLKYIYDIKGEKKEQMYRELADIRVKRHAENSSEASQTVNQEV